MNNSQEAGGLLGQPLTPSHSDVGARQPHWNSVLLPIKQIGTLARHTKWKALCDLRGEGRLSTCANNVLFWARPPAPATGVAWEASARSRQNTPASEPHVWVQLAADKGPLYPAVQLGA